MLHAPCFFLSSASRAISLLRLYRRHCSRPLTLRRLIFIPQYHETQIIRSYCSWILHNAVLDFFDQLLQQCTTVPQCKQVHTQIIVTVTYSSAFLAARIVSAYSRFGLVLDAQNVFDTTPVEGVSNLLLWNSILRGNVSHGYYKNALTLYVKMRRLSILGDGFTFPLIVRACGSIGGSSLCKLVHNHVLQMGLQDRLHVVNELLGMYARLGQMGDARNLFDRMTVRNHISWNMMISGFSLNYDPDGSLEIFKRMELEGLEPNPVTWTSLLSSLSRCSRHEEVLKLFGIMRKRGSRASAEALAVLLSVCADLAAIDIGRMAHGYVIKGGFEDYLFVLNSLICMYGKHGDVRNAEDIFSEMRNKNIVSWNALITTYTEAGLCDKALAIFSQLEKLNGFPAERPNMISWSAVVSGCAAQGRSEEALQLFRQMQLAKIMANSVTISSVLSICAELAALNLGKEVHGHVIRALMNDNILVGNGLVNMYMKCGSPDQGLLVFEKIDKKDIISWNSVIRGYAMHGQGGNALKFFNQMIRAGFYPDGVTFLAVLSACSHAGLVAEGHRYFDAMIKEFEIEPQMEHYACIVDLLGRAGLLQDAVDIVKKMPMKPNAYVWSALLNSCQMHKNTEVADEAASQIFSSNSEMAGSYMLLSNIYAASRRWDDSARVRTSAKTKGLKKIPGYSWIEIKKKVHVFSAGSTLQTGLEEVHEILQELALQMENEGCKSNERFSENNLEEGEKRLIVWAE